jgi:hypothetical protein
MNNSPPPLPGRGVITTLFVESDLRGTFGHLYGYKATDPNDYTEEAPTIGEQWIFYKKLIADIGYGDAYMMVAGSRKFDDPNIISRSTSDIMETIQPGDRVFVRCGPLSHVAMVYKLDRAGNKIYFADAAFQFWQPSHNSCVTSFSLTEHTLHRYLSSVSASEVKDILQAVITIRDSRSKVSP